MAFARMIEEDQYCIDVLTQAKSPRISEAAIGAFCRQAELSNDGPPRRAQART